VEAFFVMGGSDMNLETTRLLIHDPVASDWRGVLKFLTDPEVMRWIHLGPKPFNEAQTKQWIADLIYHNSHQPRFSHNSLIVERETGQIIGWIGIGVPSHDGIGDLDFGYAMARDYWGKGYMTEALKALLAFAFTELGASSVFGECEVANIGSFCVMEKAGMRLDKRYTDLEDSSEMFRYTLTKEQWLMQQPQ
jgi:RimJ/RimL family protein N-acetyltransferase